MPNLGDVNADLARFTSRCPPGDTACHDHAVALYNESMRSDHQNNQLKIWAGVGVAAGGLLGFIAGYKYARKT